MTVSSYGTETAWFTSINPSLKRAKVVSWAMGRKPNPKSDDPAESQRFVESAREAQADEADSEAFKHAVKKVALAKREMKTDR